MSKFVADLQKEIKQLEERIAVVRAQGEKTLRCLLYPVYIDGVCEHFSAIDGYETSTEDEGDFDCTYTYVIIKWK